MKEWVEITHVGGEHLCDYCDREMELHSAPNNYVLKIPFTDYTIELWDWGHKEYMCIYCMTDRDDEPALHAYHQGCQDGYEEAKRRL